MRVGPVYESMPRPRPFWWRTLHRVGLHRTANWLYAKRYNAWAPGLSDCLHWSTFVHPSLTDDQINKIRLKDIAP